VRRGFRLLTGIGGVLLVGSALALLGYVAGTGQRLNDLGWLVIIVFLLLGVLLLRRAVTRNQPISCRRCGASLTRDDMACPQCGLNLEKTAWAVIGTFKLP
jgi:hypothetical protein